MSFAKVWFFLFKAITAKRGIPTCILMAIFAILGLHYGFLIGKIGFGLICAAYCFVSFLFCVGMAGE